MHAEPNSLVVKVLKTMYYLNNDILNFKIGSNPNYLRRNVHFNIWIIA